MKTEILKSTKKNIKKIVNIIRDGGVVGYPTDTIYGLGADPFNHEAVKNIFMLKEREIGSSIILLVGKNYDITRLVNVNEVARVLMNEFWPGPLTIIMPITASAKASLSPFVYGEHTTLALRVPDSAEALDILNECNMPITSTSANLHGMPNPKNAMDVFDAFNGQIPAILDGGELNNSASTIVSVADDHIEIIREGKITKQQIMDAIKIENE